MSLKIAVHLKSGEIERFDIPNPEVSLEMHIQWYKLFLDNQIDYINFTQQRDDRLVVIPLKAIRCIELDDGNENKLLEAA